MKRSIWICLAVLLLSGCSEKAEYTCGNGVLESDEICDGSLFASELHVVCSNGMTPNKMLLGCTAKCSLDASKACASSCGNGVIEGEEQCDGTIPPVMAGCTNPDMSKLQCLNCRIVDNGVCPSLIPGNNPPVVNPQNKPDWFPENCGNGQLDEGELCDGELVREDAKQCPVNMKLMDNPSFKCLDSCRLVDVRNACEFAPFVSCGNGVLNGGEECDGEAFSEDALNAIQCGKDEKLDVTKAVCNQNCQIESACVPRIANDVGLLISEVVPHFQVSETSVAFDGLAVELTNMSKVSLDFASCSLALFSESGSEKTYSLASLGLSSLKAMESTVICSQAGPDHFEGVCNATISEDGILENMKGMAFLGLVCGNKIVDLFNLNSFIAAVQNYAVDFVRLCDAEPVTESENALLGNGWYIDSFTTYAPTYGLGSHCSSIDATIESCTYTVSRNTLTERSQYIDLALEIKIPGQTDITNKTDINPDMQIQFVTGKVAENKVKEEIIHLINAEADPNWTNSNGVDRYIGKFRNWDTYEGFLDYEAGTYVLDAAIGMGSGGTRIFCGPKGMISESEYAVYDPDKRNTLVVSYDDNGGTCGDGVLSASEVCDGSSFVGDALVCEYPGEVVYDRSKVMCSCNMLDTASACAAVPETCGNGSVDGKEVCDGTQIPEEAKVCPKNMVLLDKPVWECDKSCLAIDTFKACEFACGNNRVDSGEVCDGTDIPETAKVCPKNYIPVDKPEWSCDTKCAGIITDKACELACGNGKLDAGEACDGTSIDHAAAEAKCSSRTTYDKNRASCLETCAVDNAACVPGFNLVFDEYIVKKDENGKPIGVAISINNYGPESIDIGACNLSVLNEKGSFAVDGATYYSFLEIAKAPAGASSYDLDLCKPLVICSEPIGSETEYKDIFGDDCDVVLGGYDSNNKLINNLFLNYPAIDTLQISCGGVKIDYFDFEGFRKALSEGYTHGKLKSSDHRPWSGRTSVSLQERMDLDKTSDMAGFAKPVCE